MQIGGLVLDYGGAARTHMDDLGGCAKRARDCRVFVDGHDRVVVIVVDRRINADGRVLHRCV